MADLLDFFNGGGWAPWPRSSKFVNLSLSYLLLCYVILLWWLFKKENLCMVYFLFIFVRALMFDAVVLCRALMRLQTSHFAEKMVQVGVTILLVWFKRGWTKFRCQDTNIYNLNVLFLLWFLTTSCFCFLVCLSVGEHGGLDNTSSLCNNSFESFCFLSLWRP